MLPAALQHQMSIILCPSPLWLPRWENNLILCLQETVPHLQSLLPWSICLNISSHAHLQWNRQWRQTLWDLWWYSLEKLVWINIIKIIKGQEAVQVHWERWYSPCQKWLLDCAGKAVGPEVQGSHCFVSAWMWTSYVDQYSRDKTAMIWGELHHSSSHTKVEL